MPVFKQRRVFFLVALCYLSPGTFFIWNQSKILVLGTRDCYEMYHWNPIDGLIFSRCFLFVSRISLNFFNVVLWIKVVTLSSRPFSLTSYKTKSYGMCILHWWYLGDFIHLRPQPANSNLLIWNYPTSFMKVAWWYKKNCYKTKLT